MIGLVRQRARLVAALAPLAALLAAASPAGAATNTIATVAGTGAGGFNGDGIPAVTAALTPVGVAPTADGGYVIADQGTNRARRVSPGGVIATIATGLSSPNGVAERPDGSILIADSSNARVLSVATNGAVTVVAGTGVPGFSGDNGPATAAQLNFPAGLAVRPDGSFLIGDNDNNRVRLVSGGTITTVAGTGGKGFGGDDGPATAALLNDPGAISMMPDGGYLIADQDNQRIRRVSPLGTITTVAGTGAPGFNGDGIAATAAQLNGPLGVAATADGGFLIGDRANNRVRRVSPLGSISTLAGTGAAGFGGDGGPATAAQLNLPIGVAVTAGGDVLIADTSNRRVRLVDAGDAGGPPPPSVSPPQVQDVALAKPIAASSPVVLTAKVVGDYTRIEWNLTGDSRPEIVGTQGQTSLRYRPAAGQATVSVRAVGPGGAGAAISETMTIPKPSGSKGVLKIIGKTPPVYAVGPELALAKTTGDLGKALRNCITNTTVRGGSLEVTGCLFPITSLAEIPQAERGVLDPIASIVRVKRVGGYISEVGRVLNLLDGYLTPAGAFANVNGVDLDARGSAVIAVYPQAEVIASSGADLAVGGVKLASPNSFLLDTGKRGGAIPLGSFARAGGIKALADFPLTGDVKVSLTPPSGATPAAAIVAAKLKLPEFLKIGGVDAQGAVTLRATAADGLILDDMRIGPIDADLGALDVQAFQIDYAKGPPAEWRGQGKACVTGGTCLDMVPPNGGVTIRDGDLKFAGATLGFPPPGIPLFPGVDLQRIGFSMGLDPTRMSANAAVKVARLYDVDGRLVLAFPSEGAPFVFDRRDVGDNFPAAFYGRVHTRTTVAASAAASVEAPVVGRIPLGNAYFLYEYPGYVAFGGGVVQDFAGIVRFEGGLSGELNVANGRFNLLGSIKGCLIDVICRGATGLISSRGLSLCLSVGPLNIGAGVVYSPFSISIWPFDGCKWSPFAEQNVRGAQADGAQLVKIKRGDPSRAIRLDGADAAPAVRVTGPDGKTLDSPATSGFVNEGSLRIIRMQQVKATVVGLQDPKPGTYRIEPLPGSPAVAKVSQASDQPDVKITAKLRGRGTTRTLAYDILRRRAQRVTFVEVAADGSSKTIGSVAGGGRGKLRFSPAPGRGRGRIEAQFELDGMPAERRVVARYKAPSPRLGRPARLKLRRHGTTLKLSWARVSGAARYEIVATTTGDPQRLRRTRGHTATIRGIAKSSGGRVTVRAVDKLRDGRPARATFRAVARRKTRFGPLPKVPRARR